MNSYSEKSGNNSAEILKQKQESDRLLLKAETVIGYMASVSFLVLVFTASFVEMPVWTRVLLIAIGFILFIVGIIYAIEIEQKAGYYECENCQHKYVPKYKSVLFAMHVGRTRYMKCPKCNKKNWHKKVISK